KCRRKSKIVLKEMSGCGTVHSFTVTHTALEGFETQVPYILAVIELAEGPKLMAQLCDVELDEVRIGMPVHAVFRRVSEDGDSGIIHYAFKFTKEE
ncbi:MAG: Zn-ribbon domain-containing OB-fold protein, partial [Candidatus Diapherotrites archaeon]|nr:Zn-ribbon domain-containing OB-fold protein [Candidatus Diapherotrites archaeon]